MMFHVKHPRAWGLRLKKDLPVRVFLISGYARFHVKHFKFCFREKVVNSLQASPQVDIIRFWYHTLFHKAAIR